MCVLVVVNYSTESFITMYLQLTQISEEKYINNVPQRHA